jgi:hypothetical protein
MSQPAQRHAYPGRPEAVIGVRARSVGIHELAPCGLHAVTRALDDPALPRHDDTACVEPRRHWRAVLLDESAGSTHDLDVEVAAVLEAAPRCSRRHWPASPIAPAAPSRARFPQEAAPGAPCKLIAPFLHRRPTPGGDRDADFVEPVAGRRPRSTCRLGHPPSTRSNARSGVHSHLACLEPPRMCP